MSLSRLIYFSSIFSLILLITGCESPTQFYKESNTQINKTNSTISHAESSSRETPAPVVFSQDAYADITPISLHQPPRWLKRRVTLAGSQLPFSFYVSQIFDNMNVNIHFDASIERGKQITMTYDGTVEGALELLSSYSNYNYQISHDGNTVNWSSYQTKTFDITFLPGTSNYTVGKSGGSSTQSAAAGGVQQTGADLGGGGQNSTLTGSTSVWNDIKTSIEALLSDEGRATVSEATTSVTVTDHPQNIERIAQYVDKINQILSKQVRVYVQVLDVILNKDFALGIDWNTVTRDMGVNNWTLSTGGNLATTANNTALTPVGLAYNVDPALKRNRKWSGTNIILQALQQQGKVSVVTSPTLTTLNNQVAQIAITSQQSYLAEISSQLTDGGSSSGITPGVVTTGFTMFLLPNIQGNKVFLSISSDISALDALTSFNATTGQACVPTTDPDSSDNGCNNDSSATQPTVIQVPSISQKSFNQRMVIPNGQTLVLAGFKTLRDSINKNSFYFIDPLGSRASDNNQEELIVLITPVIINGGNY